MKNISFLSENFRFLEVKFSIYLNRPVLVMFGAKESDHVTLIIICIYKDC